MYQNKAPHSSNSKTSGDEKRSAEGVRLDWDTDSFTCPGKVFVLGEYAVLGGAGALVAAVGPRFQLNAKAVPGFESVDSAGGSEGEAPFHPQSPVARLLDWGRNAGLPDFRLHFEDPHRGVGGFGASTAQFALVYRALAQAGAWDLDWKRAWNLYRELTRGTKGGCPPSGADLIAQWQGGVVIISPDFEYADSGWSSFDWSRLLVFSAAGQEGRKVATHDHLARLESLGDLSSADAPLVRELRPILEKGIWAVRNDQVKDLGAALNQYAEALQRAGLEAKATSDDRQALGAMPGVLGVKGAGAMQADALVVLMEPDFSKQGAKRQAVIEAAARRDLQLIANGLELQAGVACLN